MMIALVGDVALKVAQLRLADGERAVAILPREVGEAFVLCFDPFRGVLFHFLNELTDGDRARQRASDVDVVVSAADGVRWAIERATCGG